MAEELPPREAMEFDVVIVGGGPSGLAFWATTARMHRPAPIPAPRTKRVAYPAK